MENVHITVHHAKELGGFSRPVFLMLFDIFHKACTNLNQTASQINPETLDSQFTNLIHSNNSMFLNFRRFLLLLTQAESLVNLHDNYEVYCQL